MKESDGGVKDDGALDASLDTNVYFAVVDEVGAHALDVRRRGAVKVCGAESSTQLMRLGLRCRASMRYQFTTWRNYTDHAKGCRLRVGGSICLGILIIVVAIAVAGDDDDPKNFRQQHLTSGWRPGRRGREEWVTNLNLANA